MQIIPSLVEQSAKDLFDRITFLSPYYRQFQVDIEDGIFIENKTLPTQEFVDYFLNNPSNHIVFDFHLMVVDPENHIKRIDALPKKNVGIILIHYSVFPNYLLITSRYPLLKFGLVLNPEDEVSSLDKSLLSALSDIQIMTVYPGKQGQPFLSESLNKIEQLRKEGFSGKIYIDGAINEKTVPLINSLVFKPDVLCPGSYLAKSPKEELKKRVSYLSTE